MGLKVEEDSGYAVRKRKDTPGMRNGMSKGKMETEVKYAYNRKLVEARIRGKVGKVGRLYSIAIRESLKLLIT